MFQVWPILSNICDKYRADIKIIERCCRYENLVFHLLQFLNQCHLASQPDVLLPHHAFFSHEGMRDKALRTSAFEANCNPHFPLMTCRCIRFAVRCLGKAAINLLSPLVSQVRCCSQKSYNSLSSKSEGTSVSQFLQAEMQFRDYCSGTREICQRPVLSV